MPVHDFSHTDSGSTADFALSTPMIRSLQKARNFRATLFGENLFADPAWDMLLELYASELTQQRVSVSRATNASGVPLSTALRWMAVLEERNLVMRVGDPLDARRVWISLTPNSASLMHRYFAATSITSFTASSC